MGTMEDLLERTNAGMMDTVMETGGWGAVTREVESGTNWLREMGGGNSSLVSQLGSQASVI